MTEPGFSQQGVKLRIKDLYQQVKDPRWNGIASEGACFGLSVWWIIKNALGENYWLWMKGGEAEEKIKDAVEQQMNCSEFFDQSRFNVAQGIITGYVRKLRVPRTENPVIKEGPEFTGPVMEGLEPTADTEIKFGYYYISVEGLWPDQEKPSAHGIAAYISADKPCKYFDPNLGEGEVATAAEMTTELKKIVNDLYDIKDAKISKVRFVLQP